MKGGWKSHRTIAKESSIRERMDLMKTFMRKMVVMMILMVCCCCLPMQAGASDGQIGYTAVEQEMLGYIVQQEAGGYSLEHKQVIAQVVVNRVRSDQFPDTITGVLTQKNQFSSLSNWYSKKNKPDTDTLQAVENVLSGSCQDITMGATFFYAPQWAGRSAASWFENSLDYLFTLDGHRFFKAG